MPLAEASLPPQAWKIVWSIPVCVLSVGHQFRRAQLSADSFVRVSRPSAEDLAGMTARAPGSWIENALKLGA